MDNNIFFQEIQSSKPSHTNISLFDIQSKRFTFNKCIRPKFGNFALKTETLLLERQQAIIDTQNITYLTNDIFLVIADHQQIKITTKYIPSLNLISWQRQLAASIIYSYKVVDFNIVIKRLLSLLINQVKYLIPTYKNVLIDKNNQIFLNISSTVGWQLLFCEVQIAASEFRQICLFIDPDIFDRKAEERINFRVQQRGLAIILLSLIAQQLFNLPNTINIPASVSITVAKVLLSQIDAKICKFLQIKKIRQKIQQKSKELGIDLLLFFETVLTPRNANKQAEYGPITWSHILSILVPIKTHDKNLQIFMQILAQKQWKSLILVQQQAYLQKCLFHYKYPHETWNHYEVQLFLMHLMKQKLEKGLIIDRIADAADDKKVRSDSFTLYFKLLPIMGQPINQELPKLSSLIEMTNQQCALILRNLSNHFENCLVLANCSLKQEVSPPSAQNKVSHPNAPSQTINHRLTALEMYSRLM